MNYSCCGMPNVIDKKEHEDYHVREGLGEIIELKESSKDRLAEIFEEQSSFQQNFYVPWMMSKDEKVALSKEYILSASRELGEVLNVMPWKSHRKYEPNSMKIEDLREELVDVIKFVMNLYIIWELTPEDFFEDFVKKSRKVRDRLKAEKNSVKTIV